MLLVRSLGNADLTMSQNDSRDASESQALGPISSHERRVLGVFVLTALAWITRKEPFGGWSEFLGITTMGDDSVALAAALAFFIIPTNSGSTQKLLDWETAKGIPWGLLILFGGGIAIAKAFAAIWVVEYHWVALNAACNVALSCCDSAYLFGGDLFD